MSEREEAINKLLNIFSPGKFISWGVDDVSVPGVSFFSAGVLVLYKRKVNTKITIFILGIDGEPPPYLYLKKIQ